MSQIFGRPMKGVCPLTDPKISPVCIQIPHSRPVYTSEGVKEIKNPDRISRCFQPEPTKDFDMALSAPADPSDPEILAPDKPLLYAERSFMGYGQERGGVQTILRNPSPFDEVEFIYMETLPWFMRIYLHTMETRIAGQSRPDKSLVRQVYYRPAVDRARGTQLEVRMRIPPASTVLLTYDFEKSILRYTEYPPDANRGFDVPAAVITILDSPKTGSKAAADKGAGRRTAAYTLRTTTLLCSLPTPDFSMPYNVIIFTSTAIALAFGGIFNMLVRRFVAADEGPEPGLKVLIAKLKSRVQVLKKR